MKISYFCKCYKNMWPHKHIVRAPSGPWSSSFMSSAAGLPPHIAPHSHVLPLGHEGTNAAPGTDPWESQEEGHSYFLNSACPQSSRWWLHSILTVRTGSQDPQLQGSLGKGVFLSRNISLPTKSEYCWSRETEYWVGSKQGLLQLLYYSYVGDGWVLRWMDGLRDDGIPVFSYKNLYCFINISQFPYVIRQSLKTSQWEITFFV